MAVDDHGLETLKKSAEQVTAGDKSNYYHKVSLVQGSPATPPSNTNPIPVALQKHATATHTRPTVTTTSSTILASNANRKSAQIHNQSGAVIYIKLGVAAVVGEGFRIENNTFYPVPEGYTGDIRAIRNAGSGAVDVMEGTI